MRVCYLPFHLLIGSFSYKSLLLLFFCSLYEFLNNVILLSNDIFYKYVLNPPKDRISQNIWDLLKHLGVFLRIYKVTNTKYEEKREIFAINVPLSLVQRVCATNGEHLY